MSSAEKITKGPEVSSNTVELESVRQERQEALRDTLEKAEQRHKSEAKESIDTVRAEALDQAKNAENTKISIDKSPAEKRGTLLTRKHREASFRKQMDSIQPHLSIHEQRVSRIIHNKTVEKISDTLDSTVARPNALLAGSISAFLLVTVVYLLAKNYGYPLSGFETIGAFLIGWVIGLIYDYTRMLIRGKRN